MRVQVAHPGRHAVVAEFPFEQPLADWDMTNIHPVLGLHRHEVKLLEYRDLSYVVKELPDHLALREYRLLRELDEAGLPTVEAVAAVTGRPNGEGLILTRHLDYSLPYRSLLMGRGLKIPYLGDRLLDALVVLLVRIHLAGFFWGDCSLSNTLFRRDAGALQAYIIDVETAERHSELTQGQRELDLMLATDNVAGGLLDLQAAGRLADDIDPIAVALAIEDRYQALLGELTGETSAPRHDMRTVRDRLDRLHQLGFDVEEMEFVTDDDTSSIRIVPKVVEHGYHAERLTSLTGLVAGENQARRMLEDIHQFGAELQRRTGRSYPDNIVAVRWLDQRFEPTIAAIPDDLLNRLEAAEIFHQLLEHQWYMAEQAPDGTAVSLNEALISYLALLAEAPPERLQLSTDDPDIDADLDANPDVKPDANHDVNSDARLDADRDE